MASRTAVKQEEEKFVFTSPTGRLINESVFEKDVYVDERGKEGTPQYKVEVAFDRKDVEGEGTIEDVILDAIVAKWGKSAEDEYLDGKIKAFLDGDKLAREREARNKPGDAYKGKLILRASTIYNKDGQDAPGGIPLYMPDLSEITFANKGEIYPGCFVQVGITVSPYVSSFTGDHAIKFYLQALQKISDGEKLITPVDRSVLFKKIEGRTENSTRRSRRG